MSNHHRLYFKRLPADRFSNSTVCIDLSVYRKSILGPGGHARINKQSMLVPTMSVFEQTNNIMITKREFLLLHRTKPQSFMAWQFCWPTSGKGSLNRLIFTSRVNQQVAQSLATQVSEVAQVNAELVLKLNLTDTQLVLVEDLSSPDSNALILKTTAICHYQPNNESRPLICTLQVS